MPAWGFLYYFCLLSCMLEIIHDKRVFKCAIQTTVVELCLTFSSSPRLYPIHSHSLIPNLEKFLQDLPISHYLHCYFPGPSQHQSPPWLLQKPVVSMLQPVPSHSPILFSTQQPQWSFLKLSLNPLLKTSQWLPPHSESESMYHMAYKVLLSLYHLLISLTSSPNTSRESLDSGHTGLPLALPKNQACSHLRTFALAVPSVLQCTLSPPSSLC